MPYECFQIGGINVGIIGESLLAGKIREMLTPVRVEDRSADLSFNFVEKLPVLKDESFISLDNYKIGKDCIRVTERLFDYEVRTSQKPLAVNVALRKRDAFRRSKQAINKSWRYLNTHGRGLYLFALKRFVFYIYMHMLELALLKTDASLAHCSGVERNGKVVLFSAWGRIGKTTIMSKCIDKGWNFISDDSCVVSNKGIVSNHPLPMHIYKFQEKQNRPLVRRMLRNMSFFDKLMWSFWGRLKNPENVVRWVSPEEVFGKEKMTMSGEIKTVFHLYRDHTGSDFVLQKIEPENLSELMTNTILDEIQNLVKSSIVVNSCRQDSSFWKISDVYTSIFNIYSEAFKKADCYRLAIPENAMAGDIYSFIERSL